MLKNIILKPFIYLFLGGILFSFTSSYRPTYYSSQDEEIESSEEYPIQPSRQYASGKEEIAQIDNRKVDSPRVRMGDWDYKENWRYQRDAFFRGETQSKAYRDDHPYGPQGIGYDGDQNYMSRRQNYAKNGNTNLISEADYYNQNNAYRNNKETYDNASGYNYRYDNRNRSYSDQDRYGKSNRDNYRRDR